MRPRPNFQGALFNTDPLIFLILPTHLLASCCVVSRGQPALRDDVPRLLFLRIAIWEGGEASFGTTEQSIHSLWILVIGGTTAYRQLKLHKLATLQSLIDNRDRSLVKVTTSQQQQQRQRLQVLAIIIGRSYITSPGAPQSRASLDLTPKTNYKTTNQNDQMSWPLPLYAGMQRMQCFTYKALIIGQQGMRLVG